MTSILDETIGSKLSNRHIHTSIYVGALMFQVFLYGMYCILFAACIYVLSSKRILWWPLLVTAVTMFAVASADIAITTFTVFHCVLRGDQIPFQIAYSRYLLYITNNVIADGLVIYRCYIVWDCSKRIIAGPCFFLLASTVCGYLFQVSTSPSLRRLLHVYLWMTLALNVSVTALSATRIWWIARRARQILGHKLTRKYYSAVTIIVESGAIYSIYVLLDLTIRSAIIDAGMIPVVGMMPTLIIVQVGLGHGTRDVETTVSMVRAEAQTAMTTMNASLRAAQQTPVVDIQFGTSDLEQDEPNASHKIVDQDA